MLKRSLFCMKDVVAQGVLDEKYRDALHIDWQLLWACNYRCSYCYNQQKPTKENYQRDELFKTAQKLLSLNRPYYSFRLVGGEPTIHPYLIDLCQYLYSSGRNIGIRLITNGSRGVKYYQKLLANAPNHSMDIDISIHLEFANFDHISEIIQLLSNAQQRVNIRFMFNPELRAKAYDFHQKLVSLRESTSFWTDVRALRQPPQFVDIDTRYSDADLVWAKEADMRFSQAAESSRIREISGPDLGNPFYSVLCHGGDIQNVIVHSHNFAYRDGQKNFKGFYCCGGTNVVSIDSQGGWKNAVCPLFGPCPGKIFECVDSHVITPEIVYCSFTHCGCDANDYIPKFRSKAEAENFVREHKQRAKIYIRDAKPLPPLPEITYNVVAENEFLDRLSSVELLRKTVTTIDPSSTIIVTFAGVIEEAILYYQNMDLAHLPDFLLIDCDGTTSVWDHIAQKYSIRVHSNVSLKSLSNKSYCLYTRTFDYYWGPLSFQDLITRWQRLYRGSFMVDASVTRCLWKRSAHPDLIKERIADICIVYSALADSASRDHFLRAIKTLETGDPGYLRIAAFSEYHHPLVHAEQGDVVFEGGCDTGATTFSFSQQVGIRGRVYAFEPRQVSVLQTQKECETCTNVTVENLGLWSGDGVFYIEEQGGASKLSASSNAQSEECHTISLDAYIAEHSEACHLIKLDIEGAEIECLHGAMKTIQFYTPKLMISIYHELNHYIDIPLMMIRQHLGYYFYVGHHTPWYGGTCLYALPPSKHSNHIINKPANHYVNRTSTKKSRISIIIPTYNSEATIARCLDSVFLQKVNDLEIIVVDDASADNTVKVVNKYIDRHPQKLKLLTFTQNSGPGVARNAGMKIATGEFLTFVDSDDVLAQGFLPKALRMLEQEQADIVAFDMVTIKQNGWLWRWGVTPGVLAGADSLQQLLLENLGNWATYGRVYRAEMIHSYNISYFSIPVHEDIFFSIQAFFYSQRTVVVPEIGYYRYLRSGSCSVAFHGPDSIRSFSVIVGFITHFFEAHGLALCSIEYINCVTKIYMWDKNAVCHAILDAHKDGNINEVLASDQLLDIGSSRIILNLILKDYALQYCKKNQLNPTIAIDDVDWRTVATAPQPPKTFTAHTNSSLLSMDVLPLSVIVANFNKASYIAKCLDSILSQSMTDYELIIVDDASTDNSFEILKSYAEKYSCIRLFRMDHNQGQSVCQNIAVDLARGNAITFVDSDDWIEQDFFHHGLSIMQKNNADVVIFSTQDELMGGSTGDTKICKPLRAGGMTACTAYWAGHMPWGTWGKIYATKLIQKNSIRFEDGLFHQDLHFLTKVFRASTLCLTDEKIMYHVVLSPQSSIRPKHYRYAHIRSACRKAALRYSVTKNQWTTLTDDAFLKKQIWSTEARLLPPLAAFYRSTNEIALAENDYLDIQDNVLFLRALLLGYALCTDPEVDPQNRTVV